MRPLDSIEEPVARRENRDSALGPLEQKLREMMQSCQAALQWHPLTSWNKRQPL